MVAPFPVLPITEISPTFSFRPDEYQRFGQFIEENCGIVLGENKHYLVASRLNRLIREYGIQSLGDLVEKLRYNHMPGFREKIIEAITTNETSWFRDSYPFSILKELIFPTLQSEHANPIRLWSAACSSGQEAYSIQMVAKEYFAQRPETASKHVEITATDISLKVLNEAKSGIYEGMALDRGLSSEYRQRFFLPLGGDRWQVKPELRSHVTFSELNLLQNYHALGRFHIIFCRNVLIYFSYTLKCDIIARMAQILHSRGWLFLGSSESLTNYSDQFEMIRFNPGVVYRLKK